MIDRISSTIRTLKKEVRKIRAIIILWISSCPTSSRRVHPKKRSYHPWAGLIASCGSFYLMVPVPTVKRSGAKNRDQEVNLATVAISHSLLIASMSRVNSRFPGSTCILITIPANSVLLAHHSVSFELLIQFLSLLNWIELNSVQIFPARRSEWAGDGDQGIAGRSATAARRLAVEAIPWWPSITRSRPFMLAGDENGAHTSTP